MKVLETTTLEEQMDRLVINALEVSTQIGVHIWEQRIKQKLLIDISIFSDFSACEDDISKTYDYDLLCRTITQWVESKSFQLIETVANEVADLIQQVFKVSKLRVAVSKPYAIKNAGPIQVIVSR